MNFWKKTASICLFGFAICLPGIAFVDLLDAECGTDAYSVPGTIPTIGTAKAVVIYACGPNAPTDTLPDWWARVWDTAQQHSIPRFYKDNSLGQYIMLPAPYGRDAGHCFKSTGPFPVDTVPPIDPFIGLNDYSFFYQIMTQADAAINFANFDGDSDHKVDAFFFVVVNHGGSAGLGGSWGWTTNDSVNGQPVIITGDRSTRNLIASEPRAVYVCSHEWGHMLGSPDLWNPFGSTWGVGSFSVMGNGFPGLRTFPFDPWNRIKFGWVTPTNVTSPIYGDSIPDYLTTGTVFKLAISDSEYFLVTNHRGIQLSQKPAAFWEEQMPGNGGILVWHIDEATRSNKKLIDVELAHGLYNFANYQPDTLNPNDSTGRDSLDLRGAKPDGSSYGYTYPSLASATCWWNSQTKSTFDGLSNPSSDGYSSSIINGIRAQNIPSHLAVRKIQAGNFSSATADLLVSNWYGHLAQNTTWGPNKAYAITGDITVDSGYALTIDSATTVYLQNSEDNQRAGVDTNKIEIRVAKGGNLIVNGTLTAPVKFVSSRSEALAGTDDWQGIIIKPGAYFSISNAVIRHAYCGIEDSSKYLHTIQNVRIGRCKMYGINAGETDSLTIRGCRVDSVFANPGGYGINIEADNRKGAVLKKDTVRNSNYGIYLAGTTSPVDSCMVYGTSLAGIVCLGQGYPYDTNRVLISNTTISGYFNYEHLLNDNLGRSVLTNCNLISATSPYRTWLGIRNTNYAAYLKVRRSRITEWNSYGVLTGHGSSQVTSLGDSAAADSGWNFIYSGTAVSSWKYVFDQNYTCCDTPLIKAEWNCWGVVNPSSSRFSGNIDYLPRDLSCMIPDPKLATGEEKEILPRVTELYQNYPNPFNPTTLIQFNLQKAEKVSLEIFNILGQKVRTLLSGEEFAAGPYSFLWDGKDDRGSPLSSGMYLYRLFTPTYLKTNKMILVK